MCRPLSRFDIGDGLLRGAGTGLAGYVYWPCTGSGTSGSWPQWRNGAWVYESKGTHPFSIGNVVTGDHDKLYHEYAHSGGNRPSLNSSGKPARVIEHEYAHSTASHDAGAMGYSAVEDAMYAKPRRGWRLHFGIAKYRWRYRVCNLRVVPPFS